MPEATLVAASGRPAEPVRWAPTAAPAPRPPARVLRAGTVFTVPAAELAEADARSRREREIELEQLVEQARAAGHAEGVRQSLADGQRAVLRAADTLDTLTRTVLAQQDREVDATSATVLGLALTVAEWVLRRELRDDGATLLRQLEEGLTALLPSPTTRISVSHEDHELVAEWADSRGRVGTEVVADSRLAPGDAVVVTDAGRAEITVAAALRTAAEVLGLPSEGRSA